MYCRAVEKGQARTRAVILNGLIAGMTTEYTELQRLLSGVHSVMRIKFALAGEGGGVHAHSLLLHLPSPVKLQCTLQLSGQIH